jgi:hypothetical protein
MEKRNKDTHKATQRTSYSKSAVKLRKIEELKEEHVDWDSSVGTATRYGLDGPGIEYWWGRDFPHPPRSALGPTMVPGLSRW